MWANCNDPKFLNTLPGTCQFEMDGSITKAFPLELVFFSLMLVFIISPWSNVSLHIACHLNHTTPEQAPGSIVMSLGRGTLIIVALTSCYIKIIRRKAGSGTFYLIATGLILTTTSPTTPMANIYFTERIANISPIFSNIRKELPFHEGLTYSSTQNCYSDFSINCIETWEI